MDPFDQFDRKPWTLDALCAQTGPDDATWYPGLGGSTRTAKKLCAACPAVAACLRDTLLAERPAQRHGISGATSTVERDLLMGQVKSYYKMTRADVVNRLAGIGVDADAIVAEVEQVAA